MWAREENKYFKCGGYFLFHALRGCTGRKSLAFPGLLPGMDVGPDGFASQDLLSGEDIALKKSILCSSGLLPGENIA